MLSESPNVMHVGCRFASAVLAYRTRAEQVLAEGPEPSQVKRLAVRFLIALLVCLLPLLLADKLCYPRAVRVRSCWHGYLTG